MPTVNLKNIQGATVGQVELSDELVAADLVGACVDRFLSARTNGEDQDPGGLAGAVRQGHGASGQYRKVHLAAMDAGI